MSARVGRLDSQAILDELEAAASQKSTRSKLARAVAKRGALIVAGMGLIGFGFWYTDGMPGTFIPLVIITCLILVLIGFAGYRTVQSAGDLVGGEVLIETRVLEKTSDFSKPAVATLLSMLSSVQSQTAASHTEFHPEYFVTFEDVGRLLVTKQVWDSAIEGTPVLLTYWEHSRTFERMEPMGASHLPLTPSATPCATWLDGFLPPQLSDFLTKFRSLRYLLLLPSVLVLLAWAFLPFVSFVIPQKNCPSTEGHITAGRPVQVYGVAEPIAHMLTVEYQVDGKTYVVEGRYSGSRELTGDAVSVFYRVNAPSHGSLVPLPDANSIVCRVLGVIGGNGGMIVLAICVLMFCQMHFRTVSGDGNNAEQ